MIRHVKLTSAGGRPAPDRQWQECFAQLVGTILSLWDASELDRVGEEAEVLPTFINLTDAAIHMVWDSLMTHWCQANLVRCPP